MSAGTPGLPVADGTPGGTPRSQPSRERYAIFLRGVNVGGITVRMVDLRATLEALPLENVGTVLASGNAVCSTTLAAGDLKVRTEEALRSRFDYQAWVIVVSADDLRAIAASVPTDPPDMAGLPAPPEVPGADKGAGRHTYVTLFSSTESLKSFLDDTRALPEQPVLLAGGPAVAWFAPKGRSTDVPLAKLLARSRYASTTTTRNVTTVEKVLRLLG